MSVQGKIIHSTGQKRGGEQKEGCCDCDSSPRLKLDSMPTFESNFPFLCLSFPSVKLGQLLAEALRDPLMNSAL